jgi:hypothetical protein
MRSIGSIRCAAASASASAFPTSSCVAGGGRAGDPPGRGRPLSDIEYLAGADNLSTCARLAAQLQQRLAHSVAEADAYCRRLRRPYLRLIH